MADINLINAQNFPTIEFSKLDWDVEVNGIPYQIVRAKGYAHCIGGRLDWGDGNDFWAYPLNEPMTFENLIEFGGVPGATWDWNILQLTTLRLNGAKLTSNLDRSY